MYEHPRSKNERGIRVSSHELIVSIYLTLTFCSNGIAVIKSQWFYLHIIGNRTLSAKYDGGVKVTSRITEF